MVFKTKFIFSFLKYYKKLTFIILELVLGLIFNYIIQALRNYCIAIFQTYQESCHLLIVMPKYY
ncbi:unnamed protein product [Paramecium octaurelia]|uniref:Uncharacterized protein n=1 Tax=Paramecium octaurelia TaxID=43137 RepID=A0A8S1Y0F6_PAROT|nr:unnamed protein product [Paramecium octaurelia]